MFRRRKSLSIIEKVRAFVWPKKGFSRAINYLVQRILRMPGSAYSLAAGFACGAAVSFTPFLGFHFVLAIVLARLLRGNMLTALIGTAVGNPWTFPLILVMLHSIGTFMMPFLGVDAASSFSFVQSEQFGMFADLFLPLVIGGMFACLLSWPVFFGLSYWLIVSWRKHRALRRARKEIEA